MRGAALALSAALAVLPASLGEAAFQAPRAAPDLIADLSAADPSARARAACELRDLGDEAAAALAPLVKLLADGAPVDNRVCGRRWSWHDAQDLTSPGELAASALAAIGSRAFNAVLATLEHEAWIARRNAAWTLGALDDPRAVPALSGALRDREPAVRAQAAWALGALDDRTAVPALIAALSDADSKVRRQTAWALGAIDDARAVDPLLGILNDHSADAREQAAWALGAIGDARATPGLVVALKDSSAGVRRQAAWALGAIGR